jgi:hypothetical protein
MNISEAYSFCESISNKDRRGAVTPEDFNSWADSAQKVFIAKRIPKYGRGEVIDPTVIPFLENQVTETEEDGTVVYPENTYMVTSIFSLKEDGSTLALARELTETELGINETSAIKKPTLRYPAFCFYRPWLQLSPRVKMKLRINYIRNPKRPNFDYKLENYKPVYNADIDPANAGETGKVSTDFEVPDIGGAHTEICFRILQYAGVNLSDQMLLQYGLTREQLGEA